MSIDTGFSVTEWLDMMADTITLNSYTGQSVSGVPTYSSTARTYKAYIETKNRRIVTSTGREIMARGRVFLGSAVVVDVRDKITMPSDTVPVSPPILAVNISSDDSGNHHTVLDIG